MEMNTGFQMLKYRKCPLSFSTRIHLYKKQASFASGGLVTALAPVLRNRGGDWIGWPGISEEPVMDLEALLKQTTQGAEHTFRPVSLTKKEVDGFYYGFANEVLWPLFHDLQTRCNFDPAYWRHYRNVNRKFAEVIARHTTARDHIWIHDYHLMCVAGELRDLGVKSKIGYFLHTPFPPLNLFLKLPWRFQILKALVSGDPAAEILRTSAHFKSSK